jgi:hypothetical protein
MKLEAIHILLNGSDFTLNSNDEIIVKGKKINLSKTKIEAKVKELEAKAEIEAKGQAIENHIYSYYPQKKQAQDNGWVSNFTTKLVASGVTDLDKQVVGFTTSFLKGSSLDEVLSGVEDETKPMYKKLVKVAVKNEWAYLVIQEGKKAIAENREPVYAEFPKFD